MHSGGRMSATDLGDAGIDADTDLAAWLVDAGLDGGPIDRLVAGFSERLVAAGLPAARVYIAMATLHPLVRARGYTWVAGQGLVDNEAMPHRAPGDEPAAWRESPFRHMLMNVEPEMYRVLSGPQPELDFPVLREFADQGFSAWTAFASSFGWDLNRADRPEDRFVGIGMISSFTTRAAGGFTDAQRARLRRLAPLLALAIKAEMLTQLAHDVTGAYIGEDAAGRVLSGAIRRGMAQKIEAVILYADLRGFTALADRLAIEPLVETLNAYFDCLGPAIAGHGGQVLKFLGDGLLASFQLGPRLDAGPLCLAALAAAREALSAVSALNGKRAAAGLPTLALDIALHRGAVMYGNVGTGSRLDFTLIGPAVNEAARLENLCASLDRALLASASFAAAAGEGAGLVPLGRHALRGVAEPALVFGLAE